MTKVGLLIPMSNIRPLFTKELFSGIKKAYSDANLNPEFYNENIGLGFQSNEVVEKAQNLLLYKDVDVIYALVGYKIVPELIKTVKTYGKKLVLLDFGTHSNIKKEIAENRDMLSCLSFGISDIYWHLGYYTSLNIGKKALVSSDFFHAGLPLVTSFESGLKQNGGEIVGYHICQNDDTSELQSGSETFRKAKEAKADLVLANYTFATIDSVLKESEKQGNPPCVTSCLNLPETLNENYENLYVGGLKYFIDLRKTHKLDSWLTTLAFANTQLHLGSNDIPSISPIQIQKGWNAEGFTENGSSSELSIEAFESERVQAQKENEELTITGWTNPYLCI